MPAALETAIMETASVLANKLASIRGVRAVVLGGSWASGTGDAHSDIDLGIYYDPAAPPALTDLRALAARHDDSGSGDAVTDFGGWGPWINGGAWLTIDGRRVDWIYRDLSKVRRVVEECVAGKPTLHYQPGHPHGFHTPIYAGELALCKPLTDAHGDIAALKAQVLPYPPELRRAIIAGSLWDANFALETAQKSAPRGDILHLSGSLFRSAACLTQALFALNELYCLNEKGALAITDTFRLCPTSFAPRISRVLSHIGIGAAGYVASLKAFHELVGETRALCGEHGFASY
jgi:predicted nucleotidyltransferase